MLLERLCQTPGVPGREDAVRDLIRAEVTALVDEVYTDALGNLFAHKKGSGPKVMLAAHMDEVGFIITSIEDNGSLGFKSLGGIDPRVMVAKSVAVGAKGIPGVIGAKPIHLQEPAERKKPIPLDQMYIDIGAKDKDQAKELVKLGDFAVFTTKFAEIGDDCWKGKAFDDRVGCAIMIEALRENYDLDLYAVFTVQEEVGLRGAGVAAYAVNPDVALVVEGTTASDVAGIPPHKHATTVGDGPALTMIDRSAIPSQAVVERLWQVAKQSGIKCQHRRSTAGGTDAGKILLSREGIPTAVAALPCRYIHSPALVVSKSDYQALQSLVVGFLRSIEDEGIPE